MRVVVTGASSLIGTAVVRSLAGRGDTAVCFQRTRAQVADTLGGAVEQVCGDIRDASLVSDVAAGCDAIVHLAAKVGLTGDWGMFRQINVDGSCNVVAAARAHGIPKLVHVSSPSVAHGGEPIVGEGAGPPVTGRRGAWYAESKAIAEIAVRGAASPDLGVVAVRPHLVWGPGDTQLVGRVVTRAQQGRLVLVGGGRALVDTTYVDNAADAIVAALDAVGPGERCSGRAYVISNGEPRPIRELVDGICRAAGVPFEPRSIPLAAATRIGSIVERAWPRLPRRWRDGEDEPPLTRFVAEQLGTAHWFDPRPARDDLGWEPAVSIDDGLERLAAWFART